MNTWHIITPEYPPALGGVADYTRLVARGLAARGGRVQVWAPAVAGTEELDSGVEVHRLRNGFTPAALATLGDSVNAAGRGRILVQYVPHGFGMRAMNLPFCLWLYAQRRAGVTVMFHEVALPLRRDQPVRHNVIALVNRAMAFILVRAALRSFVAAAGWEQMLRPLAPSGHSVCWLPVPSNVPLVDDVEGARAVRRALAREGGIVLGYFGTAREPWSIRQVEASVLPLLRERPDSTLVLLGRDSIAQHERILATSPELSQQVYAAGPLAPDTLSLYLSACDLMVQPYCDGVSTRRGSMMAALAHHRAIVTTSGVMTELLWERSGAVALASAAEPAAISVTVSRLMDEAGERERLGRAAGALYAERFDLTHTLAALTKESVGAVAA